MKESKSSLADSEIENYAGLSIVLTQIKAGEFAEALLTVQQINNESQKIESLKAIANAAHSAEHQTIALRALLHLPVAERNAILAQQVEEAKDCFLPGSEEMEWVEGYIEDDNWDDE
ncbi:hypothetical protein [Argonema galeatum]|uniref:hypothetical protein n=1 Tax=Argonema galeatum TaxID=2942762 RepID=UPI002011DF05|nr:hypothetical protein [Argonema galeatum]MCL1465406.1 hypothetical protein [Argonema galeatum A003/A1]